MKKILAITGLYVFMLFLVATVTYAADATVTCTGSGTCSLLPSGAIFSSSTAWYPGMTLYKTIKIVNNSTGTQTIGTKSQNNTTTGVIDQEFNLSITRPSTSTLIWAGTLKNFFGTGEITLAALAPSVDVDFKYTVSLNSSMGNTYQGKQTVFDLLAGFIGSSGGGGGGGMGGTGGGTPGAPTCSDTAPGSTPTLLSVTTGTNSVMLNWAEASDPVTYYLIAFGTSSGSYSYGNPNIGGKGTTSYTISGLSGGTTYYFVVRGGNGCKAGAFSNELSATPGGEFISGPPAGFAPDVLGVQENEVVGETKGIITRNLSLCKNTCLALPLGVFELILLILFFLIAGNKLLFAPFVIVNTHIPLVFSLAFMLLNKNCLGNSIFNFSQLSLCNTFIPSSFILSALAMILKKKMI